MELRHLRYFRAVAEELHFGRAAERLHVAQPPLSQQIRRLEAELGVDLLLRTTRTVELTPAGAQYLTRVVRILDEVEEAGREARRVADGVEGRLVIGCVGSATYSLLPRLVRALGESLPGIEVNVRGEMLAPEQISALLAHDIDLALLRPPLSHPEVVGEVVRRDRLLVAVPVGHRLAARQYLEPADLRDQDLVAHAGQGRSVMNTLLTSICADAGFVPRVRHEVSETSTLVTMVAAGFGLAVVPDPTAALELVGVRYIPLMPETLGVDLMVARSVSVDSPLIDRVLAVLRDAA